MKKIISLLIVSIYLTGCTTGVNLEELESANDEIDQLSSQVDSLSNEIVVLEGNVTEAIVERDLATSSVEVLEEELALSNEALAVAQIPEEEVVVEEKSYSQTGTLTGAYDGQSVLEAGNDVLWAIHLDDMAIFASYMNAVNPTYFSPSQNFVRNNLIRLSPTDVTGMAIDTTLYTWGTERVTNNPITMTISDYFDNYVSDEFYMQASIIGQNVVVSTSTVPNDIQANFFYSIYNVEYLLPEFYTSNANGEWRSITLSFIVGGTHPELIAVTHGY